MYYLKAYLRNYHFSVNFWSVLLLLAFIPDLVGFDSSILRYGFWAVKLILAFWVAYNHKKKLYQLNWQEKIFIFVAVIFFLNIFIDVFLDNRRYSLGSVLDFVSFSLSIVIAYSFRYNYIITGKKSFNFFMLTLSFGLVLAYFLAVSSPFPWIGRMDANSSFNTINYGQLGCSMSLVSLYGMVTNRVWTKKLLFFLGFLLGILSIFKAGSRSPIVVIFVVGSFYYLAKSGIFKGVVILFCAFLILWSLSGLIIEAAESMGSELPGRLLRAVESGDTSGRDQIYLNSLGLIKDSWFFGDYYLLSSGVGKRGYPHNFILESFLTTGILGGIPFLFILVIAINKSYRAIRNGHPSTWLVILFLQMVVYGMFSSSLSSSQDFWALCFFLLSMPDTNKIIKNPLIDSNKNRATLI